jgi:uncharacterized caspase-like protein
MRMGFDVDVGENLSKDAMRRAFDRLNGKIKPGAVALVFFSGHALQANRQNYLSPKNDDSSVLGGSVSRCRTGWPAL